MHGTNVKITMNLQEVGQDGIYETVLAQINDEWRVF